jgi:hypothetical protein
MGILQLVLGAILAVAGGFCAKGFSDWRDGRNMLPALAAEIQAMLRMLEQERFIPVLEGEIEWLENTRTPREFNVTFKNTYNIVFAASASKLGLISRAKTHDFWRGDSDLLRDLVTYYYTVQTVIEMSEQIRDATISQRNDRSRANADFADVFSLSEPENLLDAFKRLLDLSKKARDDAIKLSQRLQP